MSSFYPGAESVGYDHCLPDPRVAGGSVIGSQETWVLVLMQKLSKQNKSILCGFISFSVKW